MNGMIKKGIVVILLIALGALTASADQAAWITQEQAELGTAVLKNQKRIKHFCAPCGDTESTVEKVKKVEIKEQSGGYWSVYVNGKNVDLAYVYVYMPESKEWVNLAILLSIEVSDVPETID